MANEHMRYTCPHCTIGDRDDSRLIQRNAKFRYSTVHYTCGTFLEIKTTATETTYKWVVKCEMKRHKRTKGI